ncbi:hypothetical protein Clacol_006354 [Clathrus columnatus]|uniref:Transcription factor spt8 beta-propeller domain-containing protein n=1 Tax=Clathrus columnatus TaxID=1419009 RepID=A0AAV5AG55_9AGAM|nr:hypothetical protein Clacol_006354 [Clathrus columnatus]
MVHSDSEEIDGFGNEKEEDLENDNDGEIDETDADGELDVDGEADSDGDEESGSEEEDSDDGDEENEEDEVGEDIENDDEDDDEEVTAEDSQQPAIIVSQGQIKKSPSPVARRSLSPAFLRRSLLYPQFPSNVKACAVEAICALPHPVATHSLASSLCMTHLLTGSEDGYIRDYDVYTACNGKNFLSQPQRQHCGIQEGAIKAPVARMWWENPLHPPGQPDDNPVGQTFSPVYSLLMHSDALWGLSGTSACNGSINLFTIRHDPGQVVHSMAGHLGPVSAMTMTYDEQGFISAGWDGNAIQWDLNTGQKVRTYAHGSQLSAIAMRPLSGPYVPEPTNRLLFSADQKIGSTDTESNQQDMIGQGQDVDKNVTTTKIPETETETKSEASYDPLFDEPEPENGQQRDQGSQRPVESQQYQHHLSTKEENDSVLSLPRPNSEVPAVPKLPAVQAGLVPLSKKAAIPPLDPATYSKYSTDILLVASIDGQVVLWDRRAHPTRGVGRLEMSERCPPWCLSACWSYDGSHIYAGRRNGTIDMWDTRILGKTSRDTPKLLKTLRNPLSSGPVSAVVAFPDGSHVACATKMKVYSASLDNIRLWNVSEASEGDSTRRATPAFKIIAGHHGGIISQLLIDVGAKMMVSLKIIISQLTVIQRLVSSRQSSADHSKLLCDVDSIPPKSPSTSSSSSSKDQQTVESEPPETEAEEDEDEDNILTPERRKQFFKMAHGRRVSSTAKQYPLPLDKDEIKRMDIEHRLLRFVYGGGNYVGPVNDVLAPTHCRQRRILDCGTGTGVWACEMADEFPHVQVIGVDVAPIQPDFEIYDITEGRRLLPYESGYFDLVHMRSIHTGVSNYAALLREARRVLRPGGLLILAEIDNTPRTDSKQPIPSGSEGGAPGWHAFWTEYRRCAIHRGIDVSVPNRLRPLIQQTRGFERIVAQEALLPIGFWHRDPLLLTIGQLAWMDYDILLTSLRPLLLENSSLMPESVDELISAAQTDLYYPEIHPNVCLHIVYAIKSG